jgi:hypothetical protein
MFKDSDRSRVVLMMAISLLILILAIVVRASTESPFAPRVRVRWTAAVAEAERAPLERQLRLRNGTPADDNTWEYDLVDPSTASVAALVAHDEVDDTHYIDRAAARVAADAPIGTTRLPERRMAALVHSLLFDWVLLFAASATLVSGVRLASDGNSRD